MGSLQTSILDTLKIVAMRGGKRFPGSSTARYGGQGNRTANEAVRDFQSIPK